MGIVRPVMEVYPAAWLFFVPFILITTFAVLNLFVAIMVDGMQAMHKHEIEAAEAEAHSEREMIVDEVRALRDEVRALRAAIANTAGRDP